MQAHDQEKLRGFITELENVRDQRAELNQQISEIMRQAAEAQFDRKAIRRVLALRKMENDACRAHRDLVNEYLHALDATPLEAAIERAEDDRQAIPIGRARGRQREAAL